MFKSQISSFLLLFTSAFAQPHAIEGLTEPFSIVFDKDNTLYGVEYENGNRVFRLKDDQLTFIAGSKSPGGKKLGDVAAGDGGPASKGRFNGMHDLTLHPDGRLFIADTFNRRIRVIDLNTGKLSTLGDGKLTFKEPYTVDLSPDHQNLLVADLQQPPFSPIRSGPKAASKPSRQKQFPSSSPPSGGSRRNRQRW